MHAKNFYTIHTTMITYLLIRIILPTMLIAIEKINYNSNETPNKEPFPCHC